MRSLTGGAPLLWTAAAMGAGVFAGAASGCPAAVFLVLLTVPALGWILLPRWRRATSTIFVVLLLIVASASYAAVRREAFRVRREHLEAVCQDARDFTGIIRDEARSAPDGWRIPIRIESVDGHRVRPFTIDWRTKGGGRLPEPGMVVRLSGRWSSAPLQLIPSWQERNGFYGRVRADEWRPVGARWTIPGCLNRIKHRLESVGVRTLSPRAAQLLHAMLFGDEVDDGDITENFKRDGLIHLLSVGGLHIAFFLALLTGIGLALRIPRKAVFAVAILVLPAVIVMAGAKPSAIRAGLITGLVLLGYLLERPIKSLNLWGAAAVLILLVKPLELFNPGFQLSFAASGGILWLFPRWRRHFPVETRFISDPLLLSIAAQAGLLPLIALYFGMLAWTGMIANPVLVPLCAVAVQLGWLAEIIGSFWLPLAVLINAANDWILQAILGLAQWFSVWAGRLPLPPMNGLGAMIYYICLIGGVRLREVNPITGKHRVPQWTQAAVVLLLIAAIAGWSYAQSPPERLRIEVLDVGQGDSIVVTAPGGKRMLVDGGPGASYEAGLRAYIRRNMIGRFDIVVMTHAHEDHVGGLAKLMKDGDVSVGQILDPGVPHQSRVYEDFLRSALKRKIPYAKARRGMTIHLGDQVTAQVLWPIEGLKVKSNDLNHGSIVLRVNYKKQHVLLMGDADAEAEREIVQLEPGAMKAGLLKVGHHGSAYSSCPEFLAAVRPKLAFISVGKGNSFGHPNPGTVDRLTRIGALVYRTDQDGRITVDFINDKQVKVRRGTP